MKGTAITAEEGRTSELLRHIGGVLANVVVLTALLVYFGWTRSEVQSRSLGIDESILGMSTQDYLLRSVGPVLRLLLIVALAGLLWLVFDRWLLRRLEEEGHLDPVVRWTPRILPISLVVLPLTAWLARNLWPAQMYIAFPLAGAAALLLTVYSFQLRQMFPGCTVMPPGRKALLQVFSTIAVGIGLFTAAANYATVEGVELASAFVDEVPVLPSVLVYSANDLHIDAPGLRKEALRGPDSAYNYRYTGLRLLEHTGGRYFLVSDGWSEEYGVVVALADDDPVRMEFVRDHRYLD